MAFAADLSVIFFGLLAAFSWGSGDFSGGSAARRLSVASVMAISHPIGLVLLLGLARINGETTIAPNDWFWGGLAGVFGAIGLSLLYQGLAIGRAGVVAPVTSIIATAIPVVVGILWAGWPGQLTMIGFALALISLVLVSTSGGPVGDLKGLPHAVGAGLSFGVFFILIANIESEAVFLPLAIARLVSSSVMLTFALLTRRLRLPGTPLLWLAILLAGTGDVLGNTFFSLAERGGRLDIAGVLSSLYPAVTIMWAFLISRERIGRLQFVGIAAGVVAIMLIAL